MANEAEPDWDLLSSYAGLLFLATASIYAGAHGSITLTRKDKVARGQPTEEEAEEEAERISASDAYLFPVIGSVVLFGLYLVVKYLGKDWINWLLQWYFTVTGTGSTSAALIALVRWTIGSTRWHQFDKMQVVVTKGHKELTSFSFRTPALFLIPIGTLPSVLYNFGPSTTRRSAVLTDILALSFSHNALALLKIDSFKTGCVLLSGLFLYDIWWVFGTEVMVKVATNLDIPIKILWPKSMAFSDERGFTMLGLGDIVIPGLFIALAVRYDYARHARKASGTSFVKPYFWAAIIAYVAGLATTMAVMHTFQVAQPALLYLSPACILSFLLTASIRGELKDAWAWTDEPLSEEAKDTDQTTDSSAIPPSGYSKSGVPISDERGASEKPTASPNESKRRPRKTQKVD